MMSRSRRPSVYVILAKARTRLRIAGDRATECQTAPVSGGGAQLDLEQASAFAGVTFFRRSCPQ